MSVAAGGPGASPLAKGLRGLAQAFALAGAVVALATGVMVVISITGRALANAPVEGDVELTQFAIALAISLGLPWCQLRGGNIIVDFFTQKLPGGDIRTLDGIGALLVALMCALLAWRTGVGAVAVEQAGETSMIRGLPMWWTYASLAPGLALAALIALVQGVQQLLGFAPVGREDERAAEAAEVAAEARTPNT